MRFCYHLSPVTCHLSPITCHLSPVTCHLSPITYHRRVISEKSERCPLRQLCDQSRVFALCSFQPLVPF
ncbi:hypothetical protein DBB30_06470 [Yersinia pestis]|nr:hypothetical protein C6P84_01755 [Yersinia pestis]PWF36460.1 hypothetical protein DBB30_06470 [Yersinia pestis]